MSTVLKIVGGKKIFSSAARKTIPQQSQWKFDARPGGWLIAESANGERQRVFVTDKSFHARGLQWQGEWDEASAEGGETESSVEADLTAQFPGKVRKVLVAQGEFVAAGATLLLMEAMKMEFTVRAPSAGQVTKVLIQEGQQVSPGDKFFDFVANAPEMERTVK